MTRSEPSNASDDSRRGASDDLRASQSNSRDGRDPVSRYAVDASAAGVDAESAGRVSGGPAAAAFRIPIDQSPESSSRQMDEDGEENVTEDRMKSTGTLEEGAEVVNYIHVTAIG